ncbi:hypothetical protein FXO38_09812 [Capsicum annuum]|nr:hypothetical protein FXO38_09812 [Capsicum annuum]KAF3667710.1 hypothetical protein FXO37_09890 [Capsicum annuum]
MDDSSGKALFLDLATYRKTRGSIGKVKIQVDLTKNRPSHIWMGYDEDENGKGMWKNVQYEGVPDYYCYCKPQRYLPMTCTLKKKDEEDKRKKMEKVEKNGVLQQLDDDSNKVQRNKVENSAPVRQNNGNQQEDNRNVNTQDQWQV